MAEIIILSTLPLAAIMFIFRSKLLNHIALVLYGAGLLWGAFSAGTGPSMLAPYIVIDAAGKFFLCVTAAVFFAAVIYNLAYTQHADMSGNKHARYSAALLIFGGSMAAFTMSGHLALSWVFIEATTLASAYLIYFSGTKNSLEAAWKYIFICSIGISLAFIGIVFLSVATRSGGTLFFAELEKNAKFIDPFWLKIAFVFILTGFGTKSGLAPVHAWLPDAHAEALSPVSAILSGALLNTAMLGILRVYKIMKLAGHETFSASLMLVMGFLSLLAAAVFVMRVKNYKRMMAYSSIENMGIIIIGAATGGIGMTAAMIHSFAHSFLKAGFFMTAGNILHLYETKRISKVRGLLKTDPLTGWLFVALFAALSAIPPSPSFISEFFMVRAMFEKGGVFIWLAILFMGLIAAVIYGMALSVFSMAYGTAEPKPKNAKAGWLYNLPVIFLLAAALLAALLMPEFLSNMLNSAAAML
jgi:hydrogenase-4 component F